MAGRRRGSSRGWQMSGPMPPFSRIGVVGLGYAGLPTAALFAEHGLEVIGVDTDPRVRASLASGRPPFGEPDLDALVRRVVEAGRLRAVAAPEPAEAFIIAVPTPLAGAPEAPRPDLGHVEAAARAIAPVLEAGDLVVLESTVPVGTTERVAALLAACRPDLRFPPEAGERADVQVAHCPERVMPGRILHEVVHNARIIGGLTPRCAARAEALYGLVARGERHLTGAREAELAKLAENAFRDVNIAFANELALIAGRLGLDARAVIGLANRHPRVNILEPGPGVGGHCIAVDPWFIVATNPDEAALIRLARRINDARPGQVCAEVRARAAGLVRPAIACLGLAYKRDVDDLRGSPAVEIVRRLAEAGIGELMVVEPHIAALPPELAAQGLLLWDLDHALAAADMVLLLVDHAVFRRLDRARLAGRIVVDTRGVW
jgi:UDP-N-acetyl-D-mannosaminuronic acid dehydrogenase